MPTGTIAPPLQSQSRDFIVRALAYSVGVFGLLKLGWVEAHALLPFTQAQGRVAETVFGAPALPIAITAACSAADALALCAGAILAYPAPWRQRVGGTAAGVVLILLLNTIRIGTLGRAAASPQLFEILHVYVWPALLILAIAGYVFGWMELANRQPRGIAVTEPDSTASTQGRAFALWAIVCVLLFVAAAPLYLQSGSVLAVAGVIARGGAGALRLLGIEASAAGHTLWTPRGGFEVTQECISTPLIPLYFAALMAWCGWRGRVLGVAAAVPLFVGLGIARLMVVALPAAVIGSPLFLIHAFYQIILAGLVVCVAVAWGRGLQAWRISVAACLVGGVCAYLFAAIYAQGLATLSVEIPFNDAQGAMASLPSFQSGLFIALTIATLPVVGWRAAALGLGALLTVQAVTFGLLHALSRYSDLAPHIRDVRAWAIAAPLAIVMIGLVTRDRSRI